MTTSERAIDIGTINAISAIDQRHEYADARASYRQNVLDTLDECGLSAHRNEAILAYDDHIRQNWPRLSGPDAFALLRKANPGQLSILTYAVICIGEVVGVYADFESATDALATEQALRPHAAYEIVVSFLRLA